MSPWASEANIFREAKNQGIQLVRINRRLCFGDGKEAWPRLGEAAINRS